MQISNERSVPDAPEQERSHRYPLAVRRPYVWNLLGPVDPGHPLGPGRQGVLAVRSLCPGRFQPFDRRRFPPVSNPAGRRASVILEEPHRLRQNFLAMVPFHLPGDSSDICAQRPSRVSPGRACGRLLDSPSHQGQPGADRSDPGHRPFLRVVVRGVGLARVCPWLPPVKVECLRLQHHPGPDLVLLASPPLLRQRHDPEALGIRLDRLFRFLPLLDGIYAHHNLGIQQKRQEPAHRGVDPLCLQPCPQPCAPVGPGSLHPGSDPHGNCNSVRPVFRHKRACGQAGNRSGWECPGPDRHIPSIRRFPQ